MASSERQLCPKCKKLKNLYASNYEAGRDAGIISKTCLWWVWLRPQRNMPWKKLKKGQQRESANPDSQDVHKTTITQMNMRFLMYNSVGQAGQWTGQWTKRAGLFEVGKWRMGNSRRSPGHAFSRSIVFTDLVQSKFSSERLVCELTKLDRFPFI